MKAERRALPVERELHDKDLQLGDLRFRSLLGAEGWSRLPTTVRARFAKRMGPGKSVTYTGQVTCARLSGAGWLVAQLCRVIGAPLPLSRDTGVAAVVTVTEDSVGGGQVWTRMYARRRSFPQVIHSAKRFAGPTGLEEYLGCGFGIALSVEASGKGISFLSDHYFIRIARLRLRLPHWMGPGALRIDHIDRGEAQFDFVLSLKHRLLGELIHQIGHFHDAHEGERP